MSTPLALVTGASRGIGAETARLLAEAGYDVVIHYRSKAHRAEEVAATVRAADQQAFLAAADLTDPDAVAALLAPFPRLDLLVLNASGGLEKDKPADYATALNVTAQERLARLALPRMPQGSSIVFITSHLAHLYGQVPSYPAYETVAASKHAGEQRLRALLPELTAQGVHLVVVSGDMIEGTITPKLLNRAQRGVLDQRREEAGALPTIAEFARAIVAAATDNTLPTGATIFVGALPEPS